MLIFACLSAAFVIWRAVWTIPGQHRILKVILSAAVLAAAFKFHIFHRFGGPLYFAPELPRQLLLTGALIFAVHFVFFFLLLLSEFIRLAVKTVCFCRKKTLPEKFTKAASWINPALLTAAVIIALTGLYNGMKFPELRRITIKSDRLPDGMTGKKIVWLTDIHIDCMSDENHVEKLADTVNRLKPDLILLGGDLMDGRPAAIAGKLRALGKLQAADGVYGVPGNHEYYSGFAEWIDFLQSDCKIKMLLNEHTSFDYGLAVAGIGDQAGIIRNLPGPDVKKAVENIGSEKFVILLSHRPATASEAEKHRVDLQLSGHTHGGMLWGFDRLVALVNGGFASGLYRRGKLQIYVSNGTGIWGGFPLRFGHPAEITLFEFEKN